MKERGEYILYLLSRSEKPMCTSELAELMSISTRTVKMEMNDLRGELPQHGAELIAKRNYGYELKIFNEEEFQHYYGPAFLKFSVTKRYSKYDFNQIIVFCRHLVSLTRPITIEQLGQHYAMSPSNLRNYISRAKPYLATFHLTIPPHMRKGVSVVGTEANLRVALMELCAVHSHLASFDEYGAAYRRWLRCGDQERSELRHLLLHLLRESPISLRDTNSQRLSIYLLIARNRNQAGYRLSSPNRTSLISGAAKPTLAPAIFIVVFLRNMPALRRARRKSAFLPCCLCAVRMRRTVRLTIWSLRILCPKRVAWQKNCARCCVCVSDLKRAAMMRHILKACCCRCLSSAASAWRDWATLCGSTKIRCVKVLLPWSLLSALLMNWSVS